MSDIQPQGCCDQPIYVPSNHHEEFAQRAASNLVKRLQSQLKLMDRLPNQPTIEVQTAYHTFIFRLPQKDLDVIEDLPEHIASVDNKRYRLRRAEVDQIHRVDHMRSTGNDYLCLQPVLSFLKNLKVPPQFRHVRLNRLSNLSHNKSCNALSLTLLTRDPSFSCRRNPYRNTNCQHRAHSLNPSWRIAARPWPTPHPDNDQNYERAQQKKPQNICLFKTNVIFTIHGWLLAIIKVPACRLMQLSSTGGTA